MISVQLIQRKSASIASAVKLRVKLVCNPVIPKRWVASYMFVIIIVYCNHVRKRRVRILIIICLVEFFRLIILFLAVFNLLVISN